VVGNEDNIFHMKAEQLLDYKYKFLLLDIFLGAFVMFATIT
jgi:hypothetical protein